MNTSKIFAAAVFLLAAGYIFFYVDSPAGRIFGGGILTVLGLISLVKAFRKSDGKSGCCGQHKEEKKEDK